MPDKVVRVVVEFGWYSSVVYFTQGHDVDLDLDWRVAAWSRQPWFVSRKPRCCARPHVHYNMPGLRYYSNLTNTGLNSGHVSDAFWWVMIYINACHDTRTVPRRRFAILGRFVGICACAPSTILCVSLCENKCVRGLWRVYNDMQRPKERRQTRS